MKRVLVTGGSGFIGGAVVRALIDRGDLVTVLSRDPRKTLGSLPREARVAAWSPDKKGPWFAELASVDAVVHLAGAVVASRWTEKVKKRIEDSRIGSTRMLVEAIASAGRRPSVLVSASGVGYYGADRKGTLDEGSSRGNDFLAKVCANWEGEAKKAEEHGVRTVQLRIGIVLGPGGGPLEAMVMPLRLGVGRIGKGDNQVSWVHRDDVVGMILWALDDEDLKGAINCTSPYVTTGRDLADTIGSVIGRPTVVMPEVVANIVLGDMAKVVTGNLNVYPKLAVDRGYEYRHARLTPALEDALMADERVTLA